MTLVRKSKADQAIEESVDTALSSIPFVDKKSFYQRLKWEYGISPNEICYKFEEFNRALKEVFGIKQYAIQREVVRILNCRAKAGIYAISDEAEAYLKISKIFLENGEAQLTEAEIHTSLVDYALRLNRLFEENKKNLEKLRASERLATIGQTAGMVGHDLRNPLQSIVGEVYLAKANLKELPESESKRRLQESIDFILEQIIYMDKIVSDLQSLVKGLVVNKQDTELKPLIMSTLAQAALSENIEAVVDVDDGLSLVTDPELLKRALANLVINAAQAMTRGGKLTIKAQLRRKDVSIAIEDTGEGIRDEIKPKIFTPLFTTKSKGQGLGLAAAQRIMEALGGKVSFESEFGNGTTFTLTLPKKRKAEERVKPS